MTVYRKTRELAGVPVHYASRVASWDGWPVDVVDVLLAWNGQRRLSFVGADFFGFRYATGFLQLSFKCSDCGGFFNASGSTACRFDDRLVCDDCMIRRARFARLCTEAYLRSLLVASEGCAISVRRTA